MSRAAHRRPGAGFSRRGGGRGFGRSPLSPPPAITDLAGPVTIGDTLTWTAAPGSTSTQLYRDGVASGTVVSPYNVVTADLFGIPVLDVRGVNGAGPGPASNTVKWAPPSTNLKGYYTPYSPSYYTLVSGRVSAALDQSASGNDLAQAVAGNRPAIAAGGAPDGIRDAFDFAFLAGVSTQLLKASLGLSAAVTVYTIFRTPAVNMYVHDAGTPNQRALMFLAAGNVFKMFCGSFACPIAGVTGTWVVDAAVFNGASSKQNVNGGTDATGDVGAGSHAGFCIGRGDGAANGLNTLATLVLVYDGAHSDPTRAAIVADLRAVSGV